MRLVDIQAAKASYAGKIQQFPEEDISAQIVDRFRVLPRETLRRRMIRHVALPALRLGRVWNRVRTSCALPGTADIICVGERFSHEASRTALLRATRSERMRRVLIPGCYLASEDLQYWLRRGVDRLEGIDVYSLAERWRDIIPKLRSEYETEVAFRQASIEAIPFPDSTFDLVATSAVLEHVRNLRAMVDETARVIRKGGWAWHDFGPLYYTFGGDHCIAAYGSMCGFDHLLRSDRDYQRAIHDQSFFNRQPDPNLPFWARHQQFSFAEPEEYLSLFSSRFDIAHLVIRVSEDALEFRRKHGERWRALVAAGVAESSLLVKGMAVVLRKV